MTTFAWRIRFGDRPATPEELERVEEIRVEQEADMAWEARVRLSLCMDERGRWREQPRGLAEPFDRVRIEVGVDGTFTPLIDGPVARYDTALDSRPGRSTATLVVRDDSTLMNRQEEVHTFEDRPDHEVAREVFGRFPELIGDTRIESTEGTPPAAVQRGTAIQFLRDLAAVHGYHAYVLPGPTPGRSIGCFLPDPTQSGSLPPLRLLGAGRNLAELSVVENAERPERSRAHTLRLADQSVVDAETSSQDVQLLRPLPAVAEDRSAVRLVPPEESRREDAEVRTRTEAGESRWAYRVTGRLVPGCYTGVLAPYERVRIEASDSPLSGEWVLTKVSHRITPGVWVQSFEAKADSRTDPAAPPVTGPGGGLSVDLAQSFSIF